MKKPILDSAPRIDDCFSTLRAQNRAAFVPFVMGGDPDYETSLKLLYVLAEAGADLIELGMPFSDPMADGPAVQAAGLRALKNGQTLRKTLELARAFREKDSKTPLLLMGYFNPIYRYGPEKFVHDAKRAGVDGLIIVDLPPEADGELCLPAKDAGLAFIRLITPTTDEKRLAAILPNSSGFLYMVTIAGITGTKAADPQAVEKLLEKARKKTDLPIVVGFGVKEPAQAAALAKTADGVVIASVLLDLIAKKINSISSPRRGEVRWGASNRVQSGRPHPNPPPTGEGQAGFSKEIVAGYASFSRAFAESIHKARS